MAKRRRKKTTEAPPKLRPYLFHGVDIPEDPVQATGDCPFCDKPGHFGVKTETGQFRCVRCEETGNISSFLRKLWEYSKEQTHDKDYAELSEQRGVPVEALKAWGVVQSIATGEWLLPMFNKDGKLTNLSRWTQINGEWKLLSTPGQKMHPYGTQLLNKNQTTRWMCEGPWDGMAMWYALNTVRKNGDKLVKCTLEHKQRLGLKQGVFSPPGAGNFSEDWLEHVDGYTRTNIVFDNDHPKKKPNGQVLKPGWDGQQRVLKLMESTGRRSRSVYQVRWGKQGYSKDLPDGFDIRDCLVQEGGAVKMLAHITPKLKRARLGKASTSEKEAPKVEPLHRETFAELCKDWDSALHFTAQLKDTLGITLAVMVSTELKGEQLWLRVIGPPGSGKSTIAEAVSVAKEYVFAKSMFTGFHSGFTGGDRAKKDQDSSLIPLIDGKTFVVKDGDTLLTAPNRDRVLAELRDIYDGTSRAHYRNKKSVDYEDLRCTMVVCGTDDLRSLNRSSLGERFLDCEILGDCDRNPYLDRAMQNTYAAVLDSLKPESASEDNEVKQEDKMTLLKRATYGYLKHMKETLRTMPHPELSEANGERLKALGQLISFLRAKKDSEAECKVRVELATRLVAQMVKLAVCLALVHGKRSIDAEVIRLVRKVVLDTAEGFQLDILKALATFKTGGMSVKQLYLDLNIPETTARRLCSNMQEFGIVQKRSKSNRSGQRGRDVHVWQLTDDFRSLWKKAIGK